MSKRTIWEYLLSVGMTPQGVAGLMGNLQAESGLIPDRVEILCLSRYRERGKHYTDATYTAFVDDGTISKEEFLRPMGKQYGYGLAQWTSPSRKAGLYDLCKKSHKSIGDEKTQLEYLVSELKTSYSIVWKCLTTTDSIKAASDMVLTKFEMPADQSSSVKNTRYQYSKSIYEEMTIASVTADDIIAIMSGWVGYNESNGKYRKIVDIYNNYCASHGYPRGYKVPYGVAWCDVTVSAAFIKANAVSLIGGVECGVEEHIAIFKKKGIWIEDGSITPKPGYIIVYNWDDNTQPNDGYADHIGTVESVSQGATGKTITTIEGNYSDAVKRRYIPVGWGNIRGYATPKYATTNIPAVKPEKPAEDNKKGELNTTEKWVGMVTASTLNVRTWAGIEYPNIKSYPVLAYGNLVSVCDSVKASDGGTWYYVCIANKYYGFVSAKYIKKV